MSDPTPEPTRRHLMRVYKYFQPMPWGWFVLAGLGVLLFLANAEWVGGAAVLVGGALAGAWLDRASGDEVDRLREQRLEQLWPNALAACGLSEEDQVREPVMVWGPRLRDRGGAELLGQNGHDGVFRYSPVHVAVIHFTQHFLSIYECAADLFAPEPLNEATTEVYYPDIVSVSTRVPSRRLHLDDLPKHVVQLLSGQGAQQKRASSVTLVKGREFEITSKAGTAVQLFLPEAEADSPEADYGQNAVNAVRQMLRDKKSA